MKIERILFATDFSECSDTALEFASRLANDSNALLLILHVDEKSDSEDDADAAESQQPASRGEMHALLRHTRPTNPRVTYQILETSGSPAQEILKAAEEQEVDAIVIGSHGRTGLARLLTGSVAERVMRRATCPVIVVKSPICAVEDVSAAVIDGPPG